MKGLQKMPRIGELSRKQVEELELFVEKHSLDIEIGRQKTAAFVYNIYKKEEAKKRKGEEYGKKLLKDAEKLILSMKVAESGKPPVSVAPQKVSSRAPSMAGRMLEAAPASAPGWVPRGKKMVPVKEGDLMPGEFEAIKMRARESKNKEGMDSVLYLREGYYEGKPAIKIKGCPFSIIEEESPDSWKITVGRGETGLRVSASTAILEKVDFKALNLDEGVIFLLSPNYIFTLYGQGLPLEKEIRLLKEKVPNAEVHLSNSDLGKLREALRRDKIAEIERMGHEGGISIEKIGKVDAYSAYVEEFGSEFRVVPVDTISSYRRLPEREYKVDEELNSLSAKIIPEHAPREEVIATLKYMGFFFDPSREQVHKEYRWLHRKIKNEEGETREEWVDFPPFQEISRTYMNRLLGEKVLENGVINKGAISKREFEKAWMKVPHK